MKALVILALVFATSTSHAYGLSCSQLESYKQNITKELNWLREKMRATRNSDTLELYMDQYEELYAKYQNAEKAFNSDCK